MRPTRFLPSLLITALITAACSGGGSDPPAGAGHIAFIQSDGNIGVIDPDTLEVTAITTGAGPRQLYSQPTWSPDGARLAFVSSNAPVSGQSQIAQGPAVRVSLESQDAVTAAIEFVSPDGTDRTVVSTPFAPFYLYWSPDGTKLAFLGNDEPSLSLGMIDIAEGTAERIDQGAPYYFAWAPDSSELLAHVGLNELFYLTPEGTRTDLDERPGAFAAPSWQADAVVYTARDASGDRLVLARRDGTILREIVRSNAGIAAELSPDGERVAHIAARENASVFDLGPLVITGADGDVDVSERAAGFFWDRSGSRLLYLEPTPGDAAFRWGVWTEDGSQQFDAYIPSPVFFTQYLPFFTQYANSQQFFSPDNTAFVFAGLLPEVEPDVQRTGIFIQRLDDDAPPTRVADGQFATWSP